MAAAATKEELQRINYFRLQRIEKKQNNLYDKYEEKDPSRKKALRQAGTSTDKHNDDSDVNITISSENSDENNSKSSQYTTEEEDADGDTTARGLV